MHVRVELWMWLGDELGSDFQPLSEMRSGKEMDVEEGLTVIQLFDRLAAQHPFIAEKVFDRKSQKFFPNLSVIVTEDGKVVSPFILEVSVIKEGYKITVLPFYAGG
ncbi:MAG: MoaD/ThiS family protein [Deltaproteobacteria bacterium]|nr:MoaD/ThiS family protein [Deltaproteobacteria bacterium]